MKKKTITLVLFIVATAVSMTAMAQNLLNNEQEAKLSDAIEISKKLNDLKARIAPDKRVAIWDDVRCLNAIDLHVPLITHVNKELVLHNVIKKNSYL